MSKRRGQRKSNRKKKNPRHEGPAAQGDASSAPGQHESSKPSFQPELLEPRILLSATWVNTDGAPVDDAPDGGDGFMDGGGGNDVMYGGNQDDTFRFTGAQDGDVITVDGGHQTDNIDLSPYNNSQITDNGSTITVDMGCGQSFTINYSNVESITTAEGTCDPGDVPADDRAPNAVDDAVSTNEDTPVTTGNVQANDTDPNGDTLGITDFTQALNGTVADNGDGRFTYTSNADFSGSDLLTYTVDNGNGATDTATVNVTVSEVNDAPTAEAGANQTGEKTRPKTLETQRQQHYNTTCY